MKDPNAKSILVVDDEQALLGFIDTMLTDAGYAVHTAVNPIEAMAWLDSVDWKVDLIISDILMPEMDGLSFLKTVQNRANAIPLLLISAFVVPEDLWGDQSRTPFLHKPFRQDELLQAVKNCLIQPDSGARI